MSVKNPLEKKDHGGTFAVWCDTCNRIHCETRHLYRREWEESRRFEEVPTVG